MQDQFFERPIINSPYECPQQHWELDAHGQPTQHILESRRRAEFITPIPKPRKRKTPDQQEMVFNEGLGLSTVEQQYDPTPIINEIRQHVAQWRGWPNASDWQVTPETARLLKHWRHYPFNDVRPFFCQVEAVETAIWLTEVAPQSKSGKRLLDPVKALLDPYNPAGSTAYVNFTTSKPDRWQTDARRCHINWVILDSDWEAEFCRVAEAHPRVRAYVKNHSLGFEVPYRYGSESRRYRPDFIVLVDDGHGDDDLLHLVVEIKGFRGEDAKEKKSTMETYWVPGVNNLGTYGRWDFAEFRDVYEIEGDFEAKVEAKFNEMIESAAERSADRDATETVAGRS
ncbi:MAG TPA: hypothetical protein PK867_25845 [Pirellulales bacterium]|nr:hypothetical protein [Pirellulales bacterium]